MEVRVKDSHHDNFWDNDSGYSYQHQATQSGPSAPSSNYHALKHSSSSSSSNSNNNNNNQHQQQNYHKKYRDSFEEEIQKQFDTTMQQQASNNHEEAATAPHASYSLFTHHTDFHPRQQQQQQQHHQEEGQESQHMPPVYYHPPSNTATAHEDPHDAFKGMDFDALIEASHRDIAHTFPTNTQESQPPHYAVGRQFAFHVPQHHHHHQNQQNAQQLLGGEEMMTQASQPHAVMIAPPSHAFVSPIPIALHPTHPIQYLKITQPIIPHNNHK